LFCCNFQEQSKETIERRRKQNKWKKKQKLKEKRVTKQKQSKRKFAKKMRQTKAQIKGDEFEKKCNEKSRRRAPSSFSLHDDFFSTNNCPPISLKCCSSSKKHAIIKEFETLTTDISFNHCHCCKIVAINLCMASRSTEAVCSDCKTQEF
jgi:hypothetical protein